MVRYFKSAVTTLCSAALTLAAVFIIISVVWILISDYVFSDYFTVLSKIMKSSGAYSTLLATVVAAVAFQSFKDAETKRKETESKIKDIGQYSIAFQLAEDQDTPTKTCGTILAIGEDSDFDIDDVSDIDKKLFTFFDVQFLTSSKKSTNLQCIMAFEDDYFIKTKNSITQNYYQFCEKQNLQNPLYCAARQTNPDLKCETRNRFIDIIVRIPTESNYKIVWISAITDQGVLLFIKVKLKIEKLQNGTYSQLISQFSYSVDGNKIRPLYY